MSKNGIIPALRDDLEFQLRDNGTVDVRDPHLLQIYTLDANDFALAREFDGSDVETLRSKLRAKKRRVPLSRIEEVRAEFEELHLLDTEEVWEQEPNVDNVQPYSQISTRKGLRVLPVAEPEARWTCHGCGVCCHGLAVELNAEEEARIDRTLYQDILKGEDFAEWSFINADEPAKRTLRQRADDNFACVFLTADGLCHVHARQGMQAKPDACQIFPAMVMMVPNGPPRLGLRTNCSSMYKSFDDGPQFSELTDHVMAIAARTEVHKAPKTVNFFRRSVPFERYDKVCTGIRKAFDDLGLSAASIAVVDDKYLGGRVKKSRRKYGAQMLEYLEREASGPAPVEEGAYRNQLKRLRRGLVALQAMKAGSKAPALPPRIEAFLRRQLGHVLYIGGALNLPDSGYTLVGLLLALEAAMHAVGESGTLKTANLAFEVFMGPLLETTEHAWPILDTVDKSYADTLREEL